MLMDCKTSYSFSPTIIKNIDAPKKEREKKQKTTLAPKKKGEKEK